MCVRTRDFKTRLSRMIRRMIRSIRSRLCAWARDHRGTIESVVGGLAEHPQAVANHRCEAFDASEQFGLRRCLRRIAQCFGRGNQVFLENPDRALQMLTFCHAGAAASAFAVDFFKMDNLAHGAVLTPNYHRSSRDAPHRRRGRPETRLISCGYAVTK